MEAPQFIVGYGTLLYRPSLGRTVGADRGGSAELMPVRVEGFRRLYNSAPGHYEPAFQLCREPRERSAANIEPAEGSWFNGLALIVSPEELQALDRRERDYERVSVPLVHFDTGANLGTGHAYMCPLDHDRIERDSARLWPHWRDIHYARYGSYQVSEAFGRAFDATTYLADGQTLVMEQYEPHRNLLEAPPSLP